MAEAHRAKLCGASPRTTQPAVDAVNLHHVVCQLSETQTFINKGERENKIHFKINNVDFDLECANRIDMSHLNKHTSQLCQCCFGGSNTFVAGVCICLD